MERRIGKGTTKDIVRHLLFQKVVDLGLKVGNTLWILLFNEILSNGL